MKTMQKFYGNYPIFTKDKAQKYKQTERSSSQVSILSFLQRDHHDRQFPFLKLFLQRLPGPF